MMRAARRVAPLLLLASCAYFNGIYNAKEAARKAEKQIRAGREAEGAGHYAIAAVKAETVLARYPKSRWSSEALYLAGVGEAMSEQCPTAVDRLERFLARDVDARKRERATVALASCHVKLGKFSSALGMLEPVLDSRDKTTSQRATLWAARAAIGMGDNNRANALLSRVDAGATQWELAAASLQSRDLARAESLYVLRAEQGDFREEVIPALSQLWGEGHREQVLNIVHRYELSKLRSSNKARLYLTVADLLLSAESDSASREFLLRTKRLSTDTLLDKEASARLTLLSLRDRPELPDVARAVAASATSARQTAVQRRLENNLIVLSRLEKATDRTGSALFLAGEIARDSLRARMLAMNYFLRAASPQLTGLLAPKALLAAASIMPDSAESFHAQLRSRFPRSPYLMLLEGRDPGVAPQLADTDRLLRAWWDSATKFLTDSLQTLRPDTSLPAAPGSIPPSAASTRAPSSLVELTALK